MIKLTFNFKFLLWIFATTFVFNSHEAYAYCAVAQESDNDLRQAIEIINIFNSPGNPLYGQCALPDVDPDKKAGFDHLIWFTTAYFTLNDDEAVSKITLNNKPLDIKPFESVKIGNSSLDMLADETGSFLNFDYTKVEYQFDYENVFPKLELPQNDVVTIDGRAASLSCSGVSVLDSNGQSVMMGYVYLSDMLVLAATGERMGQGCWRNAGNAYLCDGVLVGDGVKPWDFADPDGVDYTKWCQSDTVSPISGNPNPFENAVCAKRTTLWRDSDGDGFGNGKNKIEPCVKWVDKTTGEEIIGDGDKGRSNKNLSRFVDNRLDCDDKSSDIHPDALEICDGVDNNCDDQIDETFKNLGTSCEVGIGACATVGVYECNGDGGRLLCSAESKAPTEETCNNLDDDCDGAIDEDLTCDEEKPTTETECADLDADNLPIDNDGDGLANCDDVDCADATDCEGVVSECEYLDETTPNCQDQDCWNSILCSVTIIADEDGDGVTITDGDCNDSATDTLAPSMSPLLEESCGDGVDNDCSGEIDDEILCSTSNTNDSSGCGCQILALEPKSFLTKHGLILLFLIQFVGYRFLRMKIQAKN